MRSQFSIVNLRARACDRTPNGVHSRSVTDLRVPQFEGARSFFFKKNWGRSCGPNDAMTDLDQSNNVPSLGLPSFLLLGNCRSVYIHVTELDRRFKNVIF